MPTDDPQWTCTSPWHQVAGQATHSRLFLSTWYLQFLLSQCSAVPLLLLSYLFTTYLGHCSGSCYRWPTYLVGLSAPCGGRQASGCRFRCSNGGRWVSRCPLPACAAWCDSRQASGCLLSYIFLIKILSRHLFIKSIFYNFFAPRW